MPWPRPAHLRKALADISTDDFLSNLISTAPTAASLRRPLPPINHRPKIRRPLSRPRSADIPLTGASPTASFFKTIVNAFVVAECRTNADAALALLNRTSTPLSNSSCSVQLKLQVLLDFDPESHSAIISGMVRSGCKLDAATYSALVSGLCRVGRIEEAWGVVERMVEEKCLPTVRCFTSIVLGYCVQGWVEEAGDLVGRMESLGCPPDTVTYTILIGALCERGEFDEVGKVLGESELKGWKPDAVVYNVYMSALCRMGVVDEAFRLVNVMRGRGLRPTMETLHILFDRLCRDWRYDSLHKAELILDWDIDVFFFHTLMSRLCQIGRWKPVLKLWASMLKRGIETLRTFTIVIRTLCRKKMLGEAKYVFYNMGFQADVVAFNTLLLGFNMESEFSEVYQLFLYMVREDVTPNEFTYSIMIDSLCREHKFSEAITCFLESIRNGLYPNLIARPIRWLVKDGKRREILYLFEEMLRRGFVLDGFIFDSVIRGFCKEGLCRSVESDIFYLIFDKMLGIR